MTLGVLGASWMFGSADMPVLLLVMANACITQLCRCCSSGNGLAGADTGYAKS